MLDALRRGAQGWLAKLLFAILIVSFGIFWNVADVFRGFGRGSIAKVGDIDIAVTEFQRAFQSQLRDLTLDGGGRITTEQALMFKLDRQVLDRLIAQAAVLKHAKSLGLNLSDQTLADGVRTDPNFAGPDGKFSRMGFDGLLRQMNVNEHGFLALRRDDEVRRQISDALAGSVVVPTPMINDLYAYREQTRTIEHVTIDPKKVTVADPDEAKLKETYDANMAQFMTPEYRHIALLVLSVDDLKKTITLTDDELKAYYTENKATYDKPERRRIQQIPFKDKASAEAARTELVSAKKNFLDVAKEQGATETDVNLGMVPKSKLIDSKIADAAFGVQRDKISDVVEGSFAIVLLRVIEIEEGKESTFDGVKEQVRDELSKKRAEALIQERFDLVEEGRNAGKSLKDIGDEQKLKYLDVAAVDRDNKTPDGKTAFDFPDAAIALKEAFLSAVGTQPEAVELPGSTFAWYDVQAVTDGKQKPFDEVKAEVKTLFISKETAKQLDELAQKYVDRLKGGEAFAKVAEDTGGKAEISETIKRQMSPPGLTTDAVKQAFSLVKGGAAYAETSDRASRVVFQLKDIFEADAPSKEQADKLAKELAGELANDDLLAYVAAVKSDLKVYVNEAELARATGAATGSDQ